MSAKSEKDPKATPAPPSASAPAPAPDSKLEPGELLDKELDKVSGGVVPRVSAGQIPGGKKPLL
jgi:hypothetical protein